ncbi:MAG: hypothetical protein QXI18_05000 [Nitrososphaerota archaeon]
MPRPREIGPGEIVSTKLSVEDAKRFRERAKQEGLNPSQLLRKIILQYLSQQGAPPSTADDPPQPDPLTLLEVEDLRDAVSQLEQQVAQLEAMAKPFLARSGPRVLTSSDLKEREWIRKRVRKLREEWYEKKRWWARLNREIPLDDVKQKLIELHGRIRSVERAL